MNSHLNRLVAALIASSLTVSFLACGDDDDAAPEEVLRILVTNDDGVGAAGIDAIVEALAADPLNDVVVSAPTGNRSSSGDSTGPSEACGDLTVSSAATLSGFPATAIDGCPADAVIYALAALYPGDQPPHLVVSGINEGQNVSKIVATQLSGTVGAAKTAARLGVPAVASSQGLTAGGEELDYPAGVDAVLVWLEENREALLRDGPPPTDVVSINIPTCTSGAIRGTIDGLPLADPPGGFFDAQDCTSTLEGPDDDVEAFLNGFVTRTQVPLD